MLELLAGYINCAHLGTSLKKIKNASDCFKRENRIVCQSKNNMCSLRNAAKILFESKIQLRVLLH